MFLLVLRVQCGDAALEFEGVIPFGVIGLLVEISFVVQHGVQATCQEELTDISSECLYPRA
jgi:hypothetical protein